MWHHSHVVIGQKPSSQECSMGVVTQKYRCVVVGFEVVVEESGESYC